MEFCYVTLSALGGWVSVQRGVVGMGPNTKFVEFVHQKYTKQSKPCRAKQDLPTHPNLLREAKPLPELPRLTHKPCQRVAGLPRSSQSLPRPHQACPNLAITLRAFQPQQASQRTPKTCWGVVAPWERQKHPPVEPTAFSSRARAIITTRL